ncbi:GAF domain-containing protein [Haloferacaceae archaeon DSL9]
MADEYTDVTPAETADLDAFLNETIQRFECTSGTLHRKDGETLELVAHEDIPEPVLERTETIPIGKGMAGLAAERREPVQVCNLQTDDSGVAKPRARETGMEGSIAIPIFGPDNTLEGTLGVAKPDPYEFSPDERDELLTTAEKIAHRL